MQKKQSNTNFSEADADVLKNVVINPENPGTILKDFTTVMEFIQSREIGLTQSDYFQLQFLSPLNEVLSKPIQINLQRPRKKTFPNLMGLYMLLRGTGLLAVETVKNKKIARINPDVLARWGNLNDTERYFTLLEVWLLRISVSDLLNDHFYLDDLLLKDALNFWSQIPPKGLIVGKKEEETLKYMPGHYNLSLLELFGLIDVLAGKPEKKQGWKIKSVKRNVFGDALFRCVHEKIVSADNFFDFILFNTMEQKSRIPFGQFQKYFAPYFPDWKSNLVIPLPEFTEGTFVFKVSLGKVYRSIAIDSRLTLEELTQAILDAFNFDKDHLYAFYFKDQFGNNIEVSAPLSKESPLTNEVKIGTLPIKVGSTMDFIFDFGDNWEFKVQLTEIKKMNLKSKYKIVERKGKAPEQYPDWDEDDFF